MFYTISFRFSQLMVKMVILWEIDCFLKILCFFRWNLFSAMGLKFVLHVYNLIPFKLVMVMRCTESSKEKMFYCRRMTYKLF